MEKIEFGKAICYSGYREGQSPKTEAPTKEQIAEDLAILVNDGYRYIRMYDPNLHARRALEIIREKQLPLKCLIGIDSDPEVNNPKCPWEKQERTDEELAANCARNDREVEKLIELAKEFDSEIFAVSVGNENTPVWGAHMVSTQRLIRHARRFKEALDKPVTFCEGVFEWPALTELAKELDFISVHSYPYHYQTKLENSVALSKKHLAEMQELFPDKQIIFTEIGWSSNDDENDKPAVAIEGLPAIETDPADNTPRATLENEKTYITELNKWIEDDQVIVFLFEAFNEPWKASSPEKSECNFGLYDVNRNKKW